MNLFELTRTLIDIPSISGEEGNVAKYLAGYLGSLGYSVELQKVDGDRANLIATTNTQAEVVLSTHMDTVPPFIPSTEDDRFIYGRGACDAKGIIAAQISAVERLRSQDIQNVGLLFTFDEEQAGIGARSANEHESAKHCRFLINGEPTDNLLATGSRGSLRVRLKTIGRAAHSAYPDERASAIEPLLDILADLRKVLWRRHYEHRCNIRWNAVKRHSSRDVCRSSFSTGLRFRRNQGNSERAGFRPG